MRRLFEQAQTLEELKKVYRDLALEHHPDRGGNVETMKRVNALYEEFFAKLKNTHKNKDGETYTKQTRETPGDFKCLIGQLIRMEGIHIEVIGSFVWISGDTKPHRDELKSLKFRWHRTKAMWYKPPEDYKRYGGKEYSMSEIRAMYGVQFEGDGKTAESDRNALQAV